MAMTRQTFNQFLAVLMQFDGIFLVRRKNIHAWRSFVACLKKNIKIVNVCCFSLPLLAQ